MKVDFGGYATKANLKCSDGRVILPNAFQHQDGTYVPLVWQHNHNDPANVLGRAKLENRPDGVYAYCEFNNSSGAKRTRELIRHGDVTSLSIHANQLVQNGSNVSHGQIREVSVVLAGANPGALIDNPCIEHSDGRIEYLEDRADIYTGLDIETEIDISHSEEESEEMTHADDEDKGETKKTVEDIFNTLNDEQKTVVYAMLAHALSEGDAEEEEEDTEDDEDVEHSDDEGEDFSMKKNVFNSNSQDDNVLTHDAMMEILEDAETLGSLKKSFIQHGVTNLEVLFPEAKAVTNQPDLISRDQGWVTKVLNAVKKTPFSRVKSVSANITEDEARARGYIKGNKKVDEQFSLLKRQTTPQTIYKKQALDRDDVIDITDFDFIAFLKAEMRMMLNEELGRAILIGDGRLSSSEDKINPLNIRPIWTDDDMYTIKKVVDQSGTTQADRTNAFIDAVTISRVEYKGSGNMSLYADPLLVATMLTARDRDGRRLYNTVAELASSMGLKEIVEVPVMENQTREADGSTLKLLGIAVNLTDYVVGADRGGAVSMFDDFDIDYNKMKYLIETRCSGALVKPYSAIVFEADASEAAG